MESLKTYHHGKSDPFGTRYPSRKNLSGFSLIEVLIVLGIFAMIMALGLIISFDSYKGYLFRTERGTVVSVLERARSRAMNNYFSTTHGVCYIEPNYIIFRGTTCTTGVSTNELIPAKANVTIIGLTPAAPVIFDQLTGKLLPQLTPVTDEISITMSQDVKTSNIKINNEGTINW